MEGYIGKNRGSWLPHYYVMFADDLGLLQVPHTKSYLVGTVE